MPSDDMAVRQNVVAAVRQEPFAHGAQREVGVLLGPFEKRLAERDLFFSRVGLGFLCDGGVTRLPCLGQFRS